MMRNMLRSLLVTSVPNRLVTPLLARRSRRHQARVLRTLGLADVAEAFIARHGLWVRYGPFAGMKYTPRAARNRLITPKLLGTYERELHAIMAHVQRAAYDVIVDIGCGEGYYSTGFAVTTRARVVAFDAEGNELSYAREMAAANGVAEKIQFRRWCKPDDLVETARSAKRMFVLSDCEGYETDLFNSASLPALQRADLLIELHGDAKPTLVQRLRNSHRLQIIPFDRANRGSRPELKEMSSTDAAHAVDECRSPQEWLWAQPLN